MPIHPTAIVDPQAQVHETADIGPYVVIESNVKIGAETRIMPFVHIGGHTTIGEKNILHTGAVVGHEPQHTAYDGRPRYTVIGDGNQFREYVTIHGSFEPESETRIGNGCFFMATSHVGHDCKVHNNVILANGALLAGNVEVDDRAFISGNCVVHQFTRVGRLVMFQGLAGVSKDVPPFMLVKGVNRVATINAVGLKRSGIDVKARGEISRAYRTIYREGHSLPSALDILRASNPCPEVQEIIDFAENSKRGILNRSARED